MLGAHQPHRYWLATSAEKVEEFAGKARRERERQRRQCAAARWRHEHRLGEEYTALAHSTSCRPSREAETLPEKNLTTKPVDGGLTRRGESPVEVAPSAENTALPAIAPFSATPNHGLMNGTVRQFPGSAAQAFEAAFAAARALRSERLADLREQRKRKKARQRRPMPEGLDEAVEAREVRQVSLGALDDIIEALAAPGRNP